MTRKGSALLIVLGMLSFMLFSGIAFSVYMRQSRLPSSFLRRTSVTRQLAKAALAEAIRDVDAAIGNDPHPGVRRSSANNYWNHRVFMGQSTAYNSDTISTLTLEGLAYLPPCLVNEARYYSRHTPTANWQKFRFEAGRFAYCAIDVSDYFDVNRILANRPRSSAASRRVTLAHIFEKSGSGGLHGAQQPGEAEAWDDWLEGDGKVRSVDDDTDAISFNSKMPLVSLADFNLLMAMESFGNIKSPFVNYIDSTGNVFYPDAGTGTDDEQAEAYRSMTFVTDSKFVNDDDEDVESLDANQPFESADMKKDAAKTIQKFLSEGSKTSWTDHYLKFLSRVGMCMLCDYLDEDSVPLSLALPTCEKIPMLCSIRPNVSDLSLKIVKSGDPKKKQELLGANGGNLVESAEATERTVSCWFDYEIDRAGMNARVAAIETMALYPYLRNEEESSYRVDGQAALYFTVSGEDVPLVIQGNRDGTGLVMGREPETSFSQDGILKLKIGQSDFTVTGGGTSTDDDMKFVKKEKDLWMKDFTSIASMLPMNRSTTAQNPSKSCILRVLRQWTQHRTKEEDGTMGQWQPATPPDTGTQNVKAKSGFGILDANGKALSDDAILEKVNAGSLLELNFAVWLRIKETSGRGKTVDLVPAWMNDDSMQSLGAAGGRTATFYQRAGGADTKRLLRFKFKANGDQKLIPLSPKSLESIGDKTLVLDAPTLVCSDPRFNHNPCNWFRTDGTDVQAAWEAKVNCTGDGRDGDYYMAVSNQGYLQSVYELAHLLRTTSPSGGDLNADEYRGDLRLQSDYGYPTEFPESFDKCIDCNNMWRTYHPYPVNGHYDDFEQIGLVPSRNGLMVNPYSDSPEVLAAAFANTPVDWAHASTNDTMNVASTLGADEFNKKYAWNAYGPSDSRLPWAAVLDLADDFQSRVRNNNQDWRDVYHGLWNGDGTDEERLAGLPLSDYANAAKIHSVDRRFLYGFWHDCFAANQQLFLIFVRAEPMMMGGGVAGNAPPQLSSRAVALVWRDPNQRKSSGSANSSGTNSTYEPHALRILFYHPLE